ncbi:MAG: L,D-transpeptidase family protein, partial [Gallionella sp.]
CRPQILSQMKKSISLFLVVFITWVGTGFARAETTIELSHTLVGERFEYEVQHGDILIGLAARFGESAMSIAQSNGIDYKGRIYPGQRLEIDNRHIVPETLGNGILINLPQRMLFFFRDGTLAGAYPVGLGKPTWPTPTGQFSVVQLTKNPIWTVPISIQDELRREGEVVLTKVPPGPDNPLGNYWIGLSLPGYGIHSTSAPPSVYQFRSHGCIRLQPQDAEKLFPEVTIGMSGQIIYAPVLLALLADGRIYLEVNPDIYNEGINVLQVSKKLAEANHLTNRIDWQKAAQVAEQQEGLARQINLRTETQ